jgi:Fe-S-cluster containining protein
VDGDGWRQLRFTGDRCVFLDERTNLCTVYSARPKQCRTFPFWRGLVEDGQWTTEAEQVCEGVGRGRLYSILEAEARIVESELGSGS